MIYVIDVKKQEVYEYSSANFCVWLTHSQIKGLPKKRYVFCHSKQGVETVFENMGIDASFLENEERTLN